MKTRAALATAAWLATGQRDHHRFREALADPRAAQLAVLEELRQQWAASSFGHAQGALEALAPRSYEDYAPLIERIAQGEKAVLTREEPTRLIPSSGSTAARKLVPSTPLLREQFNRAIHAWVVDLYSTHPHLLGGPAYWSISPALPELRSPGGLPIGFEEDSEYLGGFGRKLVDRALAVPGSVRHIRDVEHWRHATLLHLLKERELRLISVWNPSFLTQLVAPLDKLWEELIEDLDRGVTLGGVKVQDRKRARELRAQGSRHDPWPELGLISCWTDAHAASALPAMLARFPGVELQAKGLLATEAFISLPFQGRRPVAITSHYVELELDDGRLLPVWEWSEGEVGAIVVSTGGGLYRYRLHDRVEVTEFLEATPCIRFLGKDDQVSDLAGEKLSAAHVAAVLEELEVHGFAMLAPDDDEQGYTLYAELPPDAERFDLRLRRNPHYRWCVEVGQLRPCRVFQLEDDPEATFLWVRQLRGQRLGDIKPTPLDLQSGWGGFFKGRRLR